MPPKPQSAQLQTRDKNATSIRLRPMFPPKFRLWPPDVAGLSHSVTSGPLLVKGLARLTRNIPRSRHSTSHGYGVDSPARALQCTGWRPLHTRTCGLGTLAAGRSQSLCIVGMSCLLAWDTSGSIDAAYWLAYAVVAALVLAVVLFSGSAVRPGKLALVGTALLVGFALWTALSAAWSPFRRSHATTACLHSSMPSALVTPLVTLRSSADRLAAAVAVVLGLGAFAVWTAVRLREGAIRGSSTTPDGSTSR